MVQIIAKRIELGPAGGDDRAWAENQGVNRDPDRNHHLSWFQAWIGRAMTDKHGCPVEGSETGSFGRR
jgi:hypothetical protein